MLPKNLKFGSKVESAPARSSRSNIAPQNGTSGYGLGDNIIINIPTRANLVMVPTECYLKFDFNVRNMNAGANTFRWDSCGAHGLIQRIRVYSGSNLLEDIDNYGLLAKMLFDLQVPTDASYGKYNVMSGTRNDLVVRNAGTLPTDAPTTVAAITNGTLSAVQVNSGEVLGVSIGTGAWCADTIVYGAGANGGILASPAQNTSFTYNLNLISVLGCLCSQTYFPLFACTSAPIRLEIQLIDAVQKGMLATFGTANDATINISNMEYVANFIELSDVAMSMITQDLEGKPLQFVIPQYKNFVWAGANLTNNVSTQITIPIPAKYSSVKSLFVTTRDRTTGVNTFYPFSSVTAGIDNYFFRIGPNIFPPKAPNKITEMFCETLKAMGSIADLNYQPSIEKTSYTLQNSIAGVINTDPQYNAVQSGSFYIGLDLENYSGAPKDSIFAGYNSNTDDIYCNIAYSGRGATSNTMRWDAFACFDCVYVFENNTAFIRF